MRRNTLVDYVSTVVALLGQSMPTFWLGIIVAVVMGGVLGLALDAVTVQNVSLPEELQKILDQKIGMGMVGGDMGKFMQYQTAQAIPKFAEGAGGGGGVVGDAMGLGAGVALGQVMAQQLQQGLQGGAAAAGVKPDEVMATLEKLADLKAKGILTDEEFTAKKAELLKKLV